VFGGFCLLFFAACGGGLPVFLFSMGGFVFLMPVFGVFLLGQIVLIRILPCLCGEGFLFGEFDSGSGRTLAACLTHASRTVRPFGVHEWRTGE
jgi:hypothetical protein